MIAVAALVAVRCGGSGSASTPTGSSTDTATPSTGGSGSVPAMYAQFYGATVSADGSEVVLRATSVPDHPSPYFETSNALYETPSGGIRVNPNRITPQSLVVRVPASPTAASPSDTPLGPIGVAVNGVAFFNQYAAGRSPLDAEILSFDRFNGHPQQQGMYHYHLEPLWLTAKGSSRLLGVLLDGFPVYGTRDMNGSTPADLDVCHGHTSATPEFPSGIYHYHVTADSPYIAGCFHGRAGRVG
jgi:hypothetical protein